VVERVAVKLMMRVLVAAVGCWDDRERERERERDKERRWQEPGRG
jgi:hypothetical protein